MTDTATQAEGLAKAATQKDIHYVSGIMAELLVNGMRLQKEVDRICKKIDTKANSAFVHEAILNTDRDILSLGDRIEAMEELADKAGDGLTQKLSTRAQAGLKQFLTRCEANAFLEKRHWEPLYDVFVEVMGRPPEI